MTEEIEKSAKPSKPNQKAGSQPKIRIQRLDKAKIQDEKFLTELSKSIWDILADVYPVSPWSLDYIAADLTLESSQYFLAQQAEKIVGFMAISEVMDQMELTNIAVMRDFQGQKIASRLLTELSNFVGTIFLEVRASNFPAQRLYQKNGFEPYHTRRNYYNHPIEDAILMRK